MIDVSNIQNIVNDYAANNGLFPVSVKVSKDNCIEVLVDSPSGVDLYQCAALSREIESRLDRDVEDFELTVSSAGLDLPFQVLPQYLKYTGKTVEVLFKTGKKITATLTAADAGSVTLEYTEMRRQPGDKRKKPVTVTETYTLKDIKTTKPVINF
ncbi:MAG: ribosome assembly cofactor RimP [Prevotellaceae bacterium]|jgi:ribosome maturation factor RimP|nr:ribosome assembly cofactor RimP [Prevotellaceae bacterium]